MSSKSSIYLTKDNEHGYFELNELDHPIVLEFDKNNINISANNKEDLIIKLIPGSEIYNIFKNLKQ